MFQCYCNQRALLLAQHLAGPVFPPELQGQAIPLLSLAQKVRICPLFTADLVTGPILLRDIDIVTGPGTNGEACRENEPHKLITKFIAIASKPWAVPVA